MSPQRGAVNDPVQIVANCPAKGVATLYSGPFASTGGTEKDGRITYKTDAQGEVVVRTTVSSSAPAGPAVVALLCLPDASTHAQSKLLGIPGTYFYVLG